jgi:hypothetical protein
VLAVVRLGRAEYHRHGLCRFRRSGRADCTRASAVRPRRGGRRTSPLPRSHGEVVGRAFQHQFQQPVQESPEPRIDWSTGLPTQSASCGALAAPSRARRPGEGQRRNSSPRPHPRIGRCGRRRRPRWQCCGRPPSAASPRQA